MVDPTLLLPGLSPIEGKEIVARFDGGRLSSDGGLSPSLSKIIADLTLPVPASHG